MKNFAAAANKRFAESGIKKMTVAKRAGIAQGTLSRILKEKHNPSLGVAVAIAEILDFSIDDLKENLK